MFDWASHLLLPTENPTAIQSLVVVIFAIGIGIFVGRLRVKKITLGVSAVMFAGLFLGHYGYRIQMPILEFIRDLGLIFFVYGVGLQLGPSFFSSFKQEGMKFNILAVSGVVLSGLLTYGLFLTTGLNIENLVGILSGSVTSTPALGAAKSVLSEIKTQYPDKVFSDPTIGYAITYPLGVLGVIIALLLAKIFMKIDPNEEMKKFRMKKINREYPLIPKKCRVTNAEFIGKSLHQTIQEIGKDVVISRLKHSGSKAVFSPTLDTRLRERDVLMLVGLEHDVDEFIAKVGRPSADSFIDSSSEIFVKNLFVTKKSAMHKKLSELDLYNKYDLKVTRVYRAGQEVLARPSLELFYGDKIRVVGTLSAIEEVKEIIGDSEKKLMEPDFLSLFGGVLFGILLGSIPIMLPTLPVPIKLGFAAGPLIAALLISRYGGISFVHSYFNNGATSFMKELGICLFFAAIGVNAGAKFYDNFVQYNGWLWLLYGSVITFVPTLFMLIVGTFYMKINFLQLSGLISGAHTDAAALSFSTSYLDSDIPIQSYAQVYPLVTIFRIFIAQLLVLLLA
ncbi:MAG: putative transporter [Cloacibacterium sp.]|nr:putative transporter [Cloacibacterium sp.]